MIIEHHSERPVYVISVLAIKNINGEDYPPNKRHYKYATSEYVPFFTSLINSAVAFESKEKAIQWCNKNKETLIEEAKEFGDLSTLKIRKRTVRIIEEDLDTITVEV